MRIWLTAALCLLMLAPAQAQSQTATVWFYRPAHANDLGSNPVVFYPYEIPAKRLAAMFPGEFFGYRVNPGTHAFSFVAAPARGQLVTVSLAAGQQAYVEIGPERIGPVSIDEGIRAVQKARSIAQVNAYDSNVLVPSGTMPSTMTMAATIVPAPAAIPALPETPRPAVVTPTHRSATSEAFANAKLNLQDGDTKREIDATIRYEENALIVADKKTSLSIKTFHYSAITDAEYSFAKSPRWKTAILVSPLFLFTSGKKHWLMVQGEGDYALLQLDKSNYKLILAALEARTGKKVEMVQDNK